MNGAGSDDEVGSTSGMVTFALLGPFEARLDGVPVDLGGPQQRAVLAHLLLDAGRVVPVDRLLDRIWGDDPPAAALGTLQSYVSRLRRALEPDRAAGAAARIIVSEAPGYVALVDRQAIDVVRFEDLAERGRDAAAAGDVEEAAARFDEALALWRGPALAGLSGERSIEPVAVRLEELRLAVMEDRFDAELALGRHGRAVGQLQEAVAEHPLRERLAAELALALYRSGRQADALRALSRARHTLADELGLDPGPALQQLEAQILSHDRSLVAPERAQRPAAASQPATTVVISSPSAAPASSDPDTDTAAPVLLGRERELAVVDEVLRRAAEGTTGVLLVEGEPGIGKSALLDELARRARRAGFVVAHGQSVEGAMAPALWPWVEAMRSLLVGQRGSPYALTAEAALAEAPLVASLIGSHPTPGEGGAATSPFHLADQIARVVRQICAQVPVLIVIDDLHWADDASLELLPYVVTQLAVTGAVVAGGNRPPDLGDAGALSGALGSIARMAHVRRLSLAGLDADDVAAMMAGVTGQVPSATTAAGMHGRTGGNPFFVTELTALLTSERRPDAGAAAGEAVPEAVRDVVRRRLARLPDRTLDVLAVGAVIGPEIDMRLLTHATGLAADRCLDDLDPAVVTRIVVPGSIGNFRFRHALVREAVLDDLSPLRRARLHQRTAEAIETVFGADRDHAESIAAHRWAAATIDDPAMVATALTRAADVSRSRFALDAAQDYAERALQTARVLAAGPEREALELAAVDVLLNLETVRSLMSEGSHLGELLDDIAARNDSGVARTLSLFVKWNVPVNQGRLAESEVYARRALTLAEGNDHPLELVDLHYVCATQSWASGRNAAARRHYALAIAARDEIARREGDRRAIALRVSAPLTLVGLAAVTAELDGDREAAQHLIEELLEVMQILNSSGGTIAGNFLHAVAAAVRDDRTETMRRAARIRAALPEESMAHFTPLGLALGAWAEAMADPSPAAAAVAEAALDDVLESGPARIGVPFARSLIADAFMAAGETGHAIAVLDVALDETVRSGERFWESETRRSLAMARHAAELDDLDTARAGVEAARRIAQQHEQALLVARAHASLAQLG